MVKKDIWDVLFWIAMLVIIIYIILKLVGIINSPAWVDLLPLISIVFLIGVFYQKVMNFIGIMHNRTNYLKKSIERIEDKLSNHNTRILILERKK